MFLGWDGVTGKLTLYDGEKGIVYGIYIFVVYHPASDRIIFILYFSGQGKSGFFVADQLSVLLFFCTDGVASVMCDHIDDLCLGKMHERNAI